MSAAMPICVIDCGTVQVRALIAEWRPGSEDENLSHLHILEDMERNVDLSDALHGGTLNRQGMDAIEWAIREIQRCAAAYGIAPGDIYAVGTSAMRECVNTDAVIAWVQQRTGVEIHVIDSAEEARLYFAALLRLWQEAQIIPEDQHLLMLDIGSGATVTSLIQSGTLVHSVDEHFGTMRVFDQFQGLSESADFVSTIDRFTHGAIRMILSRLPQPTHSHFISMPEQAVYWNALVVTGDEMRDLLQLLSPQQTSKLPVLQRQDLEAWYASLRPLSRPAQSRAIGCDEEQSARLMLVASLVLNLMQETGIDQVSVPQMRLRDGLIADRLIGRRDRSRANALQIRAMAHTLADRFGMDRAYADNTASLALQIFDQTRSLHQLGERERSLLEFSALVHDIGAYINVRNRHKHSMYLLHSVDLPGLDADEVEMVAHVVRYHRRAVPQLNHREFQALDRSLRVRIMVLAAILRLAYGLDVERTQRVRKLHCWVDKGRFLIQLDRRQITLERWSVVAKSQMFVDVFGLQVILLPRREE